MLLLETSIGTRARHRARQRRLSAPRRPSGKSASICATRKWFGPQTRSAPQRSHPSDGEDARGK